MHMLYGNFTSGIFKREYTKKEPFQNYLIIKRNTKKISVFKRVWQTLLKMSPHQ